MPVLLKPHATHTLGFVIDNGNVRWFVITCKKYYHKNHFLKCGIVALMAAEHPFIHVKRLPDGSDWYAGSMLGIC